jgi:hypothetical protein
MPRQDITLGSPGYQMAGQAFPGADRRATSLLMQDDRSTE